MKKWLMMMAAMILLVPTSALASVEGSSIKQEEVRPISAPITVSLEDRYDFLRDKGILIGKKYEKTQFEEPIKRTELALGLYRLFNLDEVRENATYKDVHKDLFKDVIRSVSKRGWIKEDKRVKFHSNKKMTIEEVAKVLVKATKLDVDNYASIWLPASDSAQGYMAAALTEGFLSAEDDYRDTALRSHLVYNLYEVYHFLNPKVGGIVAGSLEPKISLSNTEEDYKWTFTVKNQTEKEQIVNISGSKFDYLLKKDGKKLEQYTDNKKFIMIYLEKTLKQGEELTFSGELLDLKKGKYELEIWLTDTNWPDARATIEFEVK
jgi:hypothetical protein